MSHWESSGKSSEWYTPKYIFDALGCEFDLDVAAPEHGAPHVPCRSWLSHDSLELPWNGYIWMNPPFGGRNGIVPWLDKFFEHGNGIALTPDRTSAPWFQEAARKADAMLFMPKVRFIRPDGTTGDSPNCGTTLFASGYEAVMCLRNAEQNKLGFVTVPYLGRKAA